MTDSSSRPVEQDDTGSEPGTVTRLLLELKNGDRTALESLFPAVYDELRSLAHHQRRRWNGDTTLGTTALVNEAYIKLVDAERIDAESRLHFLRIAATAMRHVLCNYARDQRAVRRGGNVPRMSLDWLESEGVNVGASGSQSEMLVDLDDALHRLAQIDPRLSDVVECRFFGGLTIEDTARALDTSPATVKRDWALARAWLYRDLAAQ
jgi:RNA polymerase sigma factor (TIGR02999 family)